MFYNIPEGSLLILDILYQNAQEEPQRRDICLSQVYDDKHLLESYLMA
jgi:hypothetical protein